MARKTFLILIIAAFSSFITLHFANEKNHLQTNVIFEITKGSSIKSIAQDLEKAKIINNALIFRVFSKIKSIDQISYGEFEIQPKLSIIEVLDFLNQKKFVQHKISFFEGITFHEIVEKLNSNEKLTGKILFESQKEGIFLPETYVFFKNQTKEFILQQMQQKMDEFLEKAWNERKENLPLKNKTELLILASIIEKETSIEAERKDISAVFHNRLKQNLPLQADPTIIYAKNHGNNSLSRNLSKSDLQTPSPHNTYLNSGLPPTPICSPGKASILAASNPSDAEFLYFVSNNLGGHNFSKDLKTHNNFVKKYRKSLKEKK